MVQKKPGQRLAYYEVTKSPEGCNIEVGNILVDRPRGIRTIWDFRGKQGEQQIVHGNRIGFGSVQSDGETVEPEPDAKAAIDRIEGVSV